ncbi:hypothetical protein LTR17_023214 [Elasticomyces elasticus]|nr:hypothetical protein LTR17_023214 [Elasticomyces elasticus]
MKLITTICLAITVLLALPTCTASLSPSCSTALTSAITSATDIAFETTSCDCPTSEIRKPVSIATLLPKTGIFEDYDLLASRVAQVSELARTADDIHHRYFVLGNVTKGWPITLSGHAHEVLQKVSTELLKVSSLQSLEVLTKFAPGPLPSVQAHYAQWVINKYDTDSVLDADRTLVFHAAELWSLTHAFEAAEDARTSLLISRYRISDLQKDVALALQTDTISSLQVLRIRALLEELSELKEQMTKWAPGAYGLAGRMANRADNVLTVIRCGYAHEPESLLQLMRDMMVRGGKQPVSKTAKQPVPKTADVSGRSPNKFWYQSMSERFQQVKDFVGW